MVRLKQGRKSVTFESHKSSSVIQSDIDQLEQSDISEHEEKHQNDRVQQQKEKKQQPAQESSAHTQSIQPGDINFPESTNPFVTVPIHNLLVLMGMFKYGLTTNVEAILLKGLLVLIPIQILYDLLLVKNFRTHHGKRKVKSFTQDTNVPLLIVGSVIVSLILSVPIFIGLILFGAPFAANLQGTLLLAAHLSILAVNPLLVLTKFEFRFISDIFKLDKIYRFIFNNQVLSSSFGVIIGTWLGVVPIPLDWDRPWQQWPITLLAGGYIGSVVGGLVSLLSCA